MRRLDISSHVSGNKTWHFKPKRDQAQQNHNIKQNTEPREM